MFAYNQVGGAKTEWQKTMDKVRKEHPDLSFTEVAKKASELYKPHSKSKSSSKKEDHSEALKYSRALKTQAEGKVDKSRYTKKLGPKTKEQKEGTAEGLYQLGY